MTYCGSRRLTIEQKERKRLVKELSPLARQGDRRALRGLKKLGYVVFNGVDLRKMFPD